MIRETMLMLCFAAALVVAACKPQAAVADAGALAPATAATAVQSTVQPADANFDNKTFAGTFRGTLPCADCPGIDETLRLGVDGDFELTDVYRERPDSTHVVQGRWSTGNDDTRLRLAPDEKRSVDRVFAIDDNDTLTQLGMDGTRIDSALNYSMLRRR